MEGGSPIYESDAWLDLMYSIVDGIENLQFGLATTIATDLGPGPIVLGDVNDYGLDDRVGQDRVHPSHFFAEPAAAGALSNRREAFGGLAAIPQAGD
jgi:hypothetical protein